MATKAVFSAIENDRLNFNGVYLAADIITDRQEAWEMVCVYMDTLFIHDTCQGDYSSGLVDLVDLFLSEESYFYTNCSLGINITVSNDDVVIDAGAWIGDFSALAAYYGATPIVLRNIIYDANPNYKFMQRKKKLFAWV